MNLKRPVTLFVAFMALLAMAAPAICGGWPQYQKDPYNSGVSDTELSRNPELIWRSEQVDARDGTSPAVAEGKVFVVCGEDNAEYNEVIALSQYSGNVIWRQQITAATVYKSFSSPAVSDGKVFMASADKVYAFNAQDGSAAWSAPCGLPAVNGNPAGVGNSSAKIAGGRIYVGDFNNGIVYGIGIDSGSIEWAFEVDDNCGVNAPVAFYSGNVYITQTASFGELPSGKIFCVDANNSDDIIWYYEAEHDITGAPAIDITDGTVYFTDYNFAGDAYIHKLNAITGEELFRKPSPSSNSAPAVAEGRVFISTTDFAEGLNEAICFSAETGEELWRKEGIGGWIESAAIVNGMVIFGTFDVMTWLNDGGVYALDPHTGDILWSFDEGGGNFAVANEALFTLFEGRVISYGMRPTCIFDTWLCLSNPQDRDAKVRIDYQMQGGDIYSQDRVVPAGKRETVLVNGIVGVSKDVSCKITSDEAIIAERSMYFDYSMSMPGGHATAGVPSAKNSLYFAEGTTRNGFHTYLCVQNPNENEARVRVAYMFGPGQGENREAVYNIGPESRFTVDVNAEVGEDKDVSIRIESDNAIVAERPMYFHREGSDIKGGHVVTGVSEASKDLFFAEGTTRSGFETWLCIGNPGDSEAVADVTYMFGRDQGNPKQVKYMVPAGKRFTVKVNDEVGSDKDVSIKIESDSELVAERPMYFITPDGIDGGSAESAVQSLGKDWLFAEGTTREGFKTWLCVMNPNDGDVNINVKYMLGTGQGDNIERSYDIPARGRRTLLINDEIGEDKDVSISVEASGNIICERPMYFTYSLLGVAARGGHVVKGVSAPSDTWFFAEGTTRTGLE